MNKLFELNLLSGQNLKLIMYETNWASHLDMIPITICTTFTPLSCQGVRVCLVKDLRMSSLQNCCHGIGRTLHLRYMFRNWRMMSGMLELYQGSYFQCFFFHTAIHEATLNVVCIKLAYNGSCWRFLVNNSC